jgi:hypothetical protein
MRRPEVRDVAPEEWRHPDSGLITSKPCGIRAEKDWVCLQLIGPFDFALTGILEALLRPLARAKVPIFALSTFDTDWVLIPAARQADALKALAEAGHIAKQG